MQMQSKPREDVVNESGDTEEEVGVTAETEAVTDKAEIKYPKGGHFQQGL
jgi:hypothetical protein